MRRKSLAWLWGIALTSLVFASSCSGEKEPRRGQVIVAFQTDLSIPKDIKLIVVSIYAGGTKRFHQTYPLNPDGTFSLPATLAIVEGEQKNQPITIRAVGLDSAGEPHVIRQAVTTVPKERIALLHMPLQFLCYQKVDEGVDIDGTENYDDACTKQDQTCISGECVPDEIDVNTLADYAGELVFGGVGAPGLAGGQCLDVLGCFAKGTTVAPDANCTVALPGGSEENVNVGLVMPLNGQGICGTEACIVALERDDLLGWKFENGRAQLPKAVCDRLGKDINALAVTGACVTKTTSVPTCGPWSSIDGDFTFDAGAPAEGGEGGGEDPCANAEDGTYCEWEPVIGGGGETLRECAGRTTVSMTDCTASGQVCVDGASEPAFCAPASDGGLDGGDGGDAGLVTFCTGKSDGYYCSGSDLYRCLAGLVDSQTTCTSGCSNVGLTSFCTPPPDPTAQFLGNFCVNDSECGGLKCLTSTGLSDGSGPAYGMCTWPCEPGQGVCNAVSAGSGCHTFGTAQSFCLQPCSLSASGSTKCHGRVEQACADLVDMGAGGKKTMCLPACIQDTDCIPPPPLTDAGAGDASAPDGGPPDASSGFGHCSIASGLCQPVSPGSSSIGKDCSSSTCSDSVCTPFNWTAPPDAGVEAGPGSSMVCSGGCSLGNLCGWDTQATLEPPAACLLPTDPLNIQLGNLGQCVQLCGCGSSYSPVCPTGMQCNRFDAKWLKGTPVEAAIISLGLTNFGADGYCGPPIDPSGKLITSVMQDC